MNGGLGFKDLRRFNVSMLAKQGWRLLNGDNQMVTSLMKAKYYPTADFLNAELGKNPSYMWRSIMAGQEIVKQGSRRRIGNGEDTKIWKVPWLPCVQNGYITTSMPDQFKEVKVVNLMNEEQTCWDEDILKDIFNERDVDLIRRVPISNQIQHDSWFWILEQSGSFSVKSCYRGLTGEQNWPHVNFWKKLWSLDIPGKVMNFIWRACRSVVPTTVALATKRVQIDTKCTWCLIQEEDINHVLFGCSFAKEVWARVGIQEVIGVTGQEHVFEVFQSIFNVCTREKIMWIAVVCWTLWNRRNRWVWDKVMGSAFGTYSAAVNLLHDWKRTSGERQGSKAGHFTTTRCWSPPPHGWLKVNVDAATFVGNGSVGVGSVIRNETGEFVRARSRRIEVNIQPREAEAIALKEALTWIKELGIQKCIFETDSKLLADACKGVQGRSYFHTIVLDCIQLLKHFEEVLVQFVHRSANEVAHKLARATHSMSGLQEWIDVAPELISDVLINDLN